MRLLTLVALLISLSLGCGSSSTSSPTSPTPTTAPTTSGTPVSIIMGASILQSTAYSPNPVVLAAGGTVTWTNNDTVAHTSTADGGTWNSGTIGPGGTFSRTFSTTGTFAYHCAIHPGMIGTVTVQ
jgi:plastocyanin